VEGLPSQFIHTVMEKITPDLLSAYPDNRNLIKKIADHNKVNIENISLSPGSCAAIKYLFDTYINPDDSVIYTDPTFAMYPVYCQMFNAKPVVVSYDSTMSFPLSSFSEYIQKIDEVRMAVIVNPHNPTGTVISNDSIKLLLDDCFKRRILLIVDEAYYYFYPDTVAGLCAKYDNLVVLRTFSKLCGMASLRLGYVIAHEKIIKALEKVKPSFDVNGLALLFAEELLNRVDILEESKRSIETGKNYLYEKLDEAKIDYVRSNANFVLIRCNKDCAETVKKLLEKKILVAAGFYQEYLKDFIRVTLGSQAVMKRFWVAFMECLTH